MLSLLSKGVSPYDSEPLGLFPNALEDLLRILIPEEEVLRRIEAKLFVVPPKS